MRFFADRGALHQNLSVLQMATHASHRPVLTADGAKTESAATPATARPGTRASTVKLVKTLWKVRFKQCYLTWKPETNIKVRDGWDPLGWIKTLKIHPLYPLYKLWFQSWETR